MDRPSISTKTGDKGTTGLFGGKRVPKYDPRIHAYGTVDELNAVIGLILSEPGLSSTLTTELQSLQKMLFTVGADLATPLDTKTSVPRITQTEVQDLESWGLSLEQALPPLQKFILPSGCKAGAYLHLARTVSRRAERYAVELSTHEELNTHLLVFLNRLSDYLFLAARTTNKDANIHETEWVPKTVESRS